MSEGIILTSKNAINCVMRGWMLKDLKYNKILIYKNMEPIVAARVAKEASVKNLVYVHITPPLTNKTTEELYLKGVSDIFDGEIILGRDRMKFRLK